MPTVQANGLTLEYESFGDPANPPIVLVMGLGMQMIMWPEELCRMLVDKGFRVIRFDNRDVGLSSSLDHLGMPRLGLETLKFFLRLPVKSGYVVDDMARDTVGLLDALGIARAHLVGVSMGGMIAQNAAAMAPAKVASLTSIMSTTGRRSLPGPTSEARGALLEPPAKIGDIEGGTRRLMKVLRAIGSRTHPAEEGYLRTLCERHVRRKYSPAGVARQLVAIAASGNRTPAIRRIKAPTLVIHGNEDPLIRPECGADTAQAIRDGGGNASFEIVPGMGHDLPVPLLPRLAELIAEHCRRYS